MYKLRDLPFGGQDIIRLSDNAVIPMAEANTDYQKYLQWLSEGNEPLPPDEVTE
jgi:hypothetical protein